MKKVIAVLALMTFSCTSTPKVANDKAYVADQVLARIDDMASRPGWIKESEPFRIEGGKVLSLGSTVIPGDDRVEAAYRIAENSAKAGVSTGIEQRLSFVFQHAEDGTQIGSDQTRFIGTEVSNLTASSITPEKRYWEKYATTLDSGERVTRYKVYSLVSMPESEFKKAVLASLNKRAGKKGISKDFAKKVDKEWDKLVEQSSSSEQQ